MDKTTKPGAAPPRNSERRRPANDPGELADQLRRELHHLEDADEESEATGAAGRLARAYLEQAQALAWQGATRGDLEAPRRVLDALRPLEGWTDTRGLESLSTSTRVALELKSTVQFLYVADETLDEDRATVRLKDPDLSATEQAILEVLAAHEDSYLRRGQVYDLLSEDHRPTPARVGQVLAELFHDGFLLRRTAQAQGNPQTAYYRLSPRGGALCEELSPLDEQVSPSSVLQDSNPREEDVRSTAARMLQLAVASLLDTELPWDWRWIAAGTLGNYPLRQSPDLLLETLGRWLRHYPKDESSIKLIESISKTLRYNLKLLTDLSEADVDELEFLRRLSIMIDQECPPITMRAFRVEDGEITESLTENDDPASGDLHQLVREADAARETIFRSDHERSIEIALATKQGAVAALQLELSNK